jgi:hypothetical protein
MPFSWGGDLLAILLLSLLAKYGHLTNKKWPPDQYTEPPVTAILDTYQ